MCSTPRSKGLVNHLTKLKAPTQKPDDYLALLRRASRHFEAAQQARKSARRED